MKQSVLNKQGNFGVKILWRYTDMAIFVLRCFILTHPVVTGIRLMRALVIFSLCMTTDYFCSRWTRVRRPDVISTYRSVYTD